MARQTDSAMLATELRDVLGRLMRRLRAERSFPLSHGVVLARLDREGAQCVSDLAAAEHVRPQSMAQTVKELEADGLIHRRPDPDDRRRALVELTAQGDAVVQAERTRRQGWLATQIAHDLSPEERKLLAQAVDLLHRLAEG